MPASGMRTPEDLFRRLVGAGLDFCVVRVASVGAQNRLDRTGDRNRVRHELVNVVNADVVFVQRDVRLQT